MLLRERRGLSMSDTTIKKVEAASSPRGEMGQRYLVAGKRVSMRIWIDEPGGKLKGPSSREYETVGYVISGSAKLEIEGQTLNLKRGARGWCQQAPCINTRSLSHSRLWRRRLPRPRSMDAILLNNQIPRIPAHWLQYRVWLNKSTRQFF
jgi:hypothetical protein